MPGNEVVCEADGPCVVASCEPDVGCALENTTEPCDDQNACTTNDVCANGSCEGAPVACDDSVGCTLDSCDPSVGCVNEPSDALCDAQGLCTEALCQPGLGCVEETLSNCCGNTVVEGDEELSLIHI